MTVSDLVRGTDRRRGANAGTYGAATGPSGGATQVLDVDERRSPVRSWAVTGQADEVTAEEREWARDRLSRPSADGPGGFERLRDFMIDAGLGRRVDPPDPRASADQGPRHVP